MLVVALRVDSIATLKSASFRSSGTLALVKNAAGACQRTEKGSSALGVAFGKTISPPREM